MVKTFQFTTKSKTNRTTAIKQQKTKQTNCEIISTKSIHQVLHLNDY